MKENLIEGPPELQEDHHQLQLVVVLGVVLMVLGVVLVVLGVVLVIVHGAQSQCSEQMFETVFGTSNGSFQLP